MTKPKLVTAGIRWRGQWDVIGFSRDEWELEVQVVKNSVVDGGEMLKFELGVPGVKPFKEHNFIIVEERSLEDVSDPLMLLCVCRQVVDMTGNGGLSVG